MKDDFLAELLDEILGDGASANRETFADCVNKALRRLKAERASAGRLKDAAAVVLAETNRHGDLQVSAMRGMPIYPDGVMHAIDDYLAPALKRMEQPVQ